MLMRAVAIVLVALASPKLASEVPASEGGRPQPGERFPIVTLPSLPDDKPRSIADFRGRKVLLHQFASW